MPHKPSASTPAPAPAPERHATPRAALHAALLGAPSTLKDLSARAGLSEKDIPAHLDHLEKSLKVKGERLVVLPAECLACGFVFEGRRRFTAPARCPTCQSERIRPPAFHIATKG
jgi:transcriptional regulator